MTSQKQIEANRANALKSTGPRTEEGKSRTRLNAIRDHITGQVITLFPEEREIFEKLKAEQIADLAPKTLAEEKLAHAIAWDTWRLDRLRATEMNMYGQAAERAMLAAEDAENADTPEDPNLRSAQSNVDTYRAEALHLDRLSLYEQRMTRNIHRNRQALRELQAERARIYQQDRREEMLLARLEDLKDQAYQAPVKPSLNGYVFSSDEIRAAAERERNLEAAACLLANKAPWVKYGATGAGSPDLFANLPDRTPPDCIPQKIHGISPESIALRKYYHPEEFEKRRR